MTWRCYKSRGGAGSSKADEREDLPRAHRRGGRARLVVLAAEVGGRWSAETAQFFVALSNAKAESVPELLRGRVAAAWLRRWSTMLACSAVKAFA